jgi:hypothetical protein
MEKGSPGHGPELRDLLLIGAVWIHGPDLGLVFFLIEATPADAFAIGTEEGPAIISRDVREPLRLRSVRRHQVNVHEPRFLTIEAFLPRCIQRCTVGMPVRCKDDPLAIGTDRSLGVIAPHLRQVYRWFAGERAEKQIIIFIVVPRVAFLCSRGPLLEFGFLFGSAALVFVRRSVEKPLVVRQQPGTGRLAGSVRKPPDVAGSEIEEVDLIERIVRLAFALEDHPAAIGTEIPLASPLPGQGQLPRIRQKCVALGGKGKGSKEKKEGAHVSRYFRADTHGNRPRIRDNSRRFARRKRGWPCTARSAHAENHEVRPSQGRSPLGTGLRWSRHNGVGRERASG